MFKFSILTLRLKVLSSDLLTRVLCRLSGPITQTTRLWGPVLLARPRVGELISSAPVGCFVGSASLASLLFPFLPFYCLISFVSYCTDYTR